MKITVNRKELLQVMKRLLSVIPARTTMPILHSALLKADSDGIALHATDLDHWVSVTLAGDVDQVGTALLPVKKIEKAVKAFTGDTLSIIFTGDGDVETCRVLLQCGQTKFKMDTRAVEDYPLLPEFKSKCDFRISSDILSSMIEKTVYAVATDRTRPVLLHVFCELSKRKLTMTATDGARLSTVETSSMQSPNVSKPIKTLILPKALQVLKTYVEKDSPVWVHIGEKMVKFSTKHFQVSSRLGGEEYPDYKRALPPAHGPQSFTVSREEFLEIVKRMLVFTDPLWHIFKIEVQRAKMTLSAHNEDTGTASEDLQCMGSGLFTVKYNALYLKQLLQSIESEQVELSMEDPTKAGIIEEKVGGIKHKAVLMPTMPDKQ